MKKYSFNKQCLTASFKQKVKLAEALIKSFPAIEEEKRQFYSKGVYKDPERNVFLYVLIGRKCIGIGKGEVNDCQIRYSEIQHPELNFMALPKKDLEVYRKQLIK